MRKQIINRVIRCGDSAPVDLNFFRALYNGDNPQMVDSKEVHNVYDTEDDYNILFQSTETASSAGASFTATLLRDNHLGAGKKSFPARGFQLLDKENMVWYSIEAKDDSVDFSHKLTLKPHSATVVGTVKQHKKYLVVPARMVRGSSCPLVTNEMPSTPWMQKIKPVRFRRDWELEIDLLRGYNDQLVFTILYDNEGNEVDAWDTYQTIKAREGLQRALNLYAFTGNPVTNNDLIEGVATMVVDDVHTGFYGYLPTLKYGGGNVLDYDQANGLNLASDLQPFFLAQDALKRTKTYTIMHGLPFMASLTQGVNAMVRLQDGNNAAPAYSRNGGAVRYEGITSFEWLGKRLNFKLWDGLNDSRNFGSPYYDHVAIMTPGDGVTTKDGRNVPAIEFFQYGLNGETGGYDERVVDKRNTTLCEWLAGSVWQSEMMAFHCPGQHMLIQPIQRC